MNTQQNQNEIKKKGVQVNPSRDLKYDEKEKDFSAEFGEQVEAAGEEINPSELDSSEVELGQEEGQPSKPEQSMSGDLGGDISKISGTVKNTVKKEIDKTLRH